MPHDRSFEQVQNSASFPTRDDGLKARASDAVATTKDHFRKIVVTGDPYEKPWLDKNGVTFIGIMPFLLNPKSIEML